MKRKATALLAAILMLFTMLPLAGCGDDGDDKDNTPNYPVEVGGVRFVGQPSKVVCYSSTLVGIIYAMGYQNQLFGRTANCDYKEADDLKACGTPDNPSVDLLVGNKVDKIRRGHTGKGNSCCNYSQSQGQGFHGGNVRGAWSLF